MQPASTDIHIPPEIVELFVDELALQHDHSSKAALRACALVSKGVHNRVAYHLFSTINIVQRNRSDGLLRMFGRLKDLLQLLTDNPSIGPRIRTFSLETWIQREPPISEFGYFKMHMLPDVLQRLVNLNMLCFNNRHDTIRFSQLGGYLVAIFKELSKSPSLSRIKLRNIDVSPLKLLTSCNGLKTLCLVIPIIHVHNRNTPLPPSIQDPFPFMLESAEFCNGAPAVKELLLPCNALTSKVFCRLKNLTVAFRSHEDILTAWGIMLQASESLESLTVSSFVDSNYLDLIGNPVDLSLIHTLRFVDVTIYAESGTEFPMSVCKLFTIRESANNIENIKINLQCGMDGDGGGESFWSTRGWSALDEALTCGRYGALKNLVLKLRLNYQWSTPAIIEAQKATIISYARRILPMVIASTKFRIVVQVTAMTENSKRSYLVYLFDIFLN
ncbi:hypothetical protein B0H34DRAFT_798682 [Crassisporium funariophilum]|nr:hypothetical protein B0H34DRAFT_798682 [Crassisporium funariophilum]